MLQTWSGTCGHGSGTPHQKLGDWKGGSDEDKMDKHGSDGEVCVCVRFYVSDMLVSRPTAMQPARQKGGSC